MQINPNEIVVNDRIRKDFGDIKELADNIAQIGLIEPIVVSTDLPPVLIAGERRLRAVKSLGWNRVEIRTIAVEDAEHALMMEISENEARKEFTMTERLDWGNRLKLIEEVKAKQRMIDAHADNKTDDLARENFPQLGRVNDIVAKAVGFGNRKNYEHAQYIADHKDDISPEDFANWDEGKLSTNKVYTALKQKLAEAEEKISTQEKQIQQYKDVAEEGAQAMLAVRNAQNPDQSLFFKLQQDREAAIAELQDLRNKIKNERGDHNSEMRKQAAEIDKLKKSIAALQNAEPQVVEKIVEKTVMPDDYDKIKQGYGKMQRDLEATKRELENYRRNIEKSIEEMRSPENATEEDKFVNEFSMVFGSFISRYNGIANDLDYIDKLNDSQRDTVSNLVVKAKKIVNNVDNYVGGI